MCSAPFLRHSLRPGHPPDFIGQDSVLVEGNDPDGIAPGAALAAVAPSFVDVFRAGCALKLHVNGVTRNDLSIRIKGSRVELNANVAG